MVRLTTPTALTAVCAAALTVTALAAAPTTAAPHQAAPARSAPARSAPLSPAGGVFKASVVRTRHGIPHITAHDWGSLGFGSGYAVAQTNLCTLADTLMTARAQRSRYLGPKGIYDDQVTLRATNLQVDSFVQDLRNRKVVEKLLADPVRGPGPQARALVRGYVAGINRYVAQTHGGRTYSDPACKGKPWLRTKATPLDLWYGVYLANELASDGVFVPQIVGATPPTATSPTGRTGFSQPAKLPSKQALLKALGRERPFGSNATAIGGDDSTTGKGMLLGNPHFPWRGRYRFTQQQLTIPGVYNIAGASLIGSPAVNIGFNNDVAWSHTVSTAYRFTPYEYQEVGSPTTYLTENGPTQLKRDVVHVRVRRPNGTLGTATGHLYRTAQGYVLNDSATLMPWTAKSFFALRDANGEQLRTIDTFLDMGKAHTVQQLLANQDHGGGMPWVNTTAADRNGTAVYADHSVVPNVSNALAAQCNTPTGRALYADVGLPALDGTFANSTCKWGTDPDAERPGIFGPGNLPELVTRTWAANANDSYWTPNATDRLTGYARIIGCEQCQRTLRTRMVFRYVTDALAKGKISPAELRGFEYANRVYGAELMRQGGALDQVCQSANGGDACTVLHHWDGHSDRTSVGVPIYQEFMKRLPANGAYVQPFDPTDPMNTPAQLNAANPQVVQAMSDAIAYLRAHHVDYHKPWGQLQVAGDRGAPAIGLGGGSGDTDGNANALASYRPQQNRQYYSPVTYGSSHIQQVSFLADGRLAAYTILTYSQAENPRSPWSADQTRLYAAEKWVRFPWTPRQIAAAAVSRTVVSGR